jgi:hypothetical protein
VINRPSRCFRLSVMAVVTGMLVASGDACNPSSPFGERTILRDKLGNNVVGQPAAVVIDEYGLKEQDLSMTDEPPGKLRAFSFLFTQGGHREEVFVWIDYSPALFSADREWDLAKVRQATVTGVTARPRKSVRKQ